jgi:hypothetical protein
LTLRRACRPDGERPALRGKQGATRRIRPIAGSPWFGCRAPAADDEEARVEASPPGECAAVARAAPHVALAAMRAITHVVGKAIRSSRRARRGAGCWLRTTMERPRDADIEEPDCVAAAIGGPSSSDRARMSGWTSRWGMGPLGDAQDDQETFDPGRRCAPAFARGCGRRHSPGRRARVSSAAGASAARTRALARGLKRARGALLSALSGTLAKAGAMPVRRAVRGPPGTEMTREDRSRAPGLARTGLAVQYLDKSAGRSLRNTAGSFGRARSNQEGGP